MNRTLPNGVPPPPKQIRFVNNEGQPPSKRRRINAACLTCRRRKTRCAGEVPTCSTCSKNGHVCLGYDEVVDKKRTLSAPAPPRRESRVNGKPTVKRGDDYLDHDDEAVDESGETQHWKSRDGLSFERAEQEHQSRHGTANGSIDRSQSNDWDPARSAQHQQQVHQNADNPRISRTVSFSEDQHSPGDRSPMRHHSEGNRVPFFRYFGPTAIVPGFKQMVVNVSYRDRRSRGSSFSTTASSILSRNRGVLFATSKESVVFDGSDDKPGYDLGASLPIYDPSDPGPIDPLIVSLIDTFFVHLGSNFPFLRRDRFFKMVEEKKVEAMLVDIICALATRFPDPSLRTNSQDSRDRVERGRIFAQRAKAAAVDAYPCPSVSAIQAYLLIAYESFGQNQDSALWMWLGSAIRMADDLGLHKKVGVKYQGYKDPWYTRIWSRRSSEVEDPEDLQGDDDDTLSPEEQIAVEQERIDTFWAVFVLDRLISFGTGRPVTYKDGDFEFPLPEPSIDPISGLPDPTPFFIRIIHLYGRVSDILNTIRNPKDLTTEKFSRVKNDLTTLYEEQDPRLHFNPINFQEYVKAGQGTTFILLHFWFHTLIIILHAPTVVRGALSPTQLLPDSRQLSMSSAKTIADILSFAELIDAKSLIGNPFTSQPIYIAACAFLMQSGAHPSDSQSPEFIPPDAGEGKASKHSLLALGANQNYQLCYKSLQQLQMHWGGVKYILTALDQKSEGIWDCETYTREEYAMTRVSRRGSLVPPPLRRFEIPASPSTAPIAYATLTGTTNSPSSSLTRFYKNSNNNNNATTSAPHQGVSNFATPHPQQNHGHNNNNATHGNTTSAPVSAPTPPGNMIYDPIRQSLPDPPPMFPPAYPQPSVSAVRFSQMPSQQHQQSSRQSHRLSVSSVASSTTQGHQSVRSMPKLDSLAVGGGGTEGSVTDNPSTPGSVGGESKLQILAAMAHGSSNAVSQHQGTTHQPPMASYTPTSYSSTAYESSFVPTGASPSSTLAETTPNHPHHHQQVPQQHEHGGLELEEKSGGGGASYPSPFTQTGGLVSGSYYPHLTDLPFDSQEINLGFPNDSEMIPPWLVDYSLPTNELLGLFEGTLAGGGGEASQIG